MSKRGVGRKRRQERHRVAEMKRRAELIASLKKALDEQLEMTRRAEGELRELKKIFYVSDVYFPERVRSRMQVDEEVFGRIPAMVIRLLPDPPCPPYLACGPYRSYTCDLTAERGWENGMNMKILSDAIRGFWEFAAKRKAEGMREGGGRNDGNDGSERGVRKG